VGMSGIEALVSSSLFPETPDLLILADTPRGLDLPQVHDQIRDLLGADPPCVYLTYAARRQVARPRGALSIPKPFLTEDLVAALEELLGLAGGTRPAEIESGGLNGTAGPLAAEIRVLVAEDNEIAAKVITTFLTKMGFAYTRVADGEQALEEAQRGAYGIAIVDLRMPKIDGLEFARRYRALAAGRPLPIVALTANASEDVKRTCLEAGMDDFLSKPVSPDLLRRTVERFAVRGPGAGNPGEGGDPLGNR